MESCWKNLSELVFHELESQVIALCVIRNPQWLLDTLLQLVSD
jgi:hypothetical protein